MVAEQKFTLCTRWKEHVQFIIKRQRVKRSSVAHYQILQQDRTSASPQKVSCRVKAWTGSALQHLRLDALSCG